MTHVPRARCSVEKFLTQRNGAATWHLAYTILGPVSLTSAAGCRTLFLCIIGNDQFSESLLQAYGDLTLPAVDSLSGEPAAAVRSDRVIQVGVIGTGVLCVPLVLSPGDAEGWGIRAPPHHSYSCCSVVTAVSRQCGPRRGIALPKQHPLARRGTRQAAIQS